MCKYIKEEEEEELHQTLECTHLDLFHLTITMDMLMVIKSALRLAMALPSYPMFLICIVIQFNSWCKNHVPWRVSWLSQPRQCCLTHEAVWSVSGLVTSFSLS